MKIAVTKDQQTGLSIVDFASPTAVLHLPAGFQDFTAGLSIFMVLYILPPLALPGGDLDFSHFLDLGPNVGPNGTDGILLQRERADQSLLEYSVFTSDYKLASSNDPVIANDHWALLEAVATGGVAGADANVDLYVNGSRVGGGLTAVPKVVVRASNLLGGSNFRNSSGDETDGRFQGSMAEVILFDRTITSDERTAIEGYLLGKWQLAAR